jgi:CRISPR/Cas system CSM-associated protein Csm3 (group 7 of RAMP superfamily)
MHYYCLKKIKEWKRRPTMAEIGFELTLVSDAEPGNGFGTELVNSLVPRNRAGMPIIPASHIKGLMRDHLNDIATILNNNGMKNLISQCFGKDGAADTGLALIISIADLVPIIPNKTNNLQTLTISRTKITKEGTAADASLRTVEAIPVGTIFKGKIQIAGTPSKASDLLLRIGLLSIDAIGGDRNRGCGACFIKIDNENHLPGELLKELLDGTTKLDEPVASYSNNIHAIGTSDKRVIFELTFEPDGSICLPETPIVGTNSIRSGFTIPASAVQGMILNRINAIAPTIADSCFASDLFRAWPLIPLPDKSTGLPVRTSMTHLISKLPDNSGKYTFCEEIIKKYNNQDVSNGSPLKSADGVLAAMENGVTLWRAGEMARQVSAHCVIQNKRNLFTVESIDIKESFRGIVSMPENAANMFRESINDNNFVQLGKARSIRGGGRLTISETTLDKAVGNSKLPDDYINRLFIVQSFILIPNDFEINSASDLLKTIAENAGWGKVKEASASVSILFGWNRSGKGEQIQNKGRLKAKKVINPGSVFLLEEPLKNYTALLFGIGGGREQGLGAVLPHPGVANSKYEINTAKNPASNVDKSGIKGFDFWESARDSGLSASQINAVRQILIQDPNEAIKYLDRQKTDRPLQIWNRWKSVIGKLKMDIESNPNLTAKAMKVWHDLRVAEEK